MAENTVFYALKNFCCSYEHLFINFLQRSPKQALSGEECDCTRTPPCTPEFVMACK